MWSNEDFGRRVTEEWISAAAILPKTTNCYRARVLEASVQAQRQSLSLHNVQTLVTSLLAVGLLLCLPGYYHSLRDPAPLRTVRISVETSSHVPAAVRGSDSYEWGLVESALAARDLSARAFQGTLCGI